VPSLMGIVLSMTMVMMTGLAITREFAFAVSLCVAACAVGPTYHPPEAPAVTRYRAKAPSDETVATDVPGGAGHRFVAPDIPAEWWKVFENDSLDALVRQALRDSPTLAEVNARLVQAREDLSGRQGATKYSQVDANGSVNTVGITTGPWSPTT